MQTKTRRHLSVNHFLGLITFLNLILVILCIASYASVMSSVGSIQFSFLRNVTKWGYDGQKLFSSLDITSYFLLATVAVDIFAIAAGSIWKFEEDYSTTRRFGVLNAFIACLALVSYYSMMTVLALRGELVYYQYPTQLVTSGGDWNFFDPTPWLLFALLASTLIMVLRQTIGLRIETSLGKHEDD